MRIEVVLGTGIGETTLSAFDAALCLMGIGSYLWLKLTSDLKWRETVLLQGWGGISGRMAEVCLLNMTALLTI